MILDASVVLSWLLEEAGSEPAGRLLARHDLAAPSIIIAEVGHVLAKHLRRRTLTADLANRAWQVFLASPLRTAPIEPITRRAFELSVALNATYYDCLYLTLAERERDRLVTLDLGFVNAVRASGQPALQTRVATLADLSPP